MFLEWRTLQNILVIVTRKINKFVGVKIDEAIVYCLGTSNRGMRSELVANLRHGRRQDNVDVVMAWLDRL